MKLSEPLIEFNLGNKKVLLPICHQLPERSFHFRGKPILCYRCLGIHSTFITMLTIQIVGILTGYFLIHFRSLFLVLTNNSLFYQFLVVILFSLPFIIDGVVQAINKKYTSKNITRFITGVLGGVGQYLMYLFLGSIYHSIF
jgi:uncharacterized membrane protein